MPLDTNNTSDMPSGAEQDAVINAAFERLAKHEPTPELLAKVVDEIDGLLRGETKVATGESTVQSPDGFNQYENRVMGALRPQGENLTLEQLKQIKEAMEDCLPEIERSLHWVRDDDFPTTGRILVPPSIGV